MKGKYGFIDRNGRIAIQPLFDRVRLFSEGLAVVTVGDKHGYVDENGHQAIPAHYDDAASFAEGLAAVKLGEKWGYIDKNGRWLIEPRFGSKFGGAGPFSEGLAPVLFNGKMGYIDHSGHFVIQPQFDFAEPFSEGLAAVGKVLQPGVSQLPAFGFVDRTGKTVVPLRYVSAGSFREGLAVVGIFRMGVKFYPQAVIDRTGKEVLALPDVGIGEFHEGLAEISQFVNGKIGFMDRSGEEVIAPRFESLEDTGPAVFSEGLAAVSLRNRLSGYIDRSGSMAISAQFGLACPFRGGLALVFGRGRVGYIERNGKFIWSGPEKEMPENDEAGCFW